MDESQRAIHVIHRNLCVSVGPLIGLNRTDTKLFCQGSKTEIHRLHAHGRAGSRTFAIKQEFSTRVSNIGVYSVNFSV